MIQTEPRSAFAWFLTGMMGLRAAEQPAQPKPLARGALTRSGKRRIAPTPPLCTRLTGHFTRGTLYLQTPDYLEAGDDKGKFPIPDGD